ncbi:MAG: hypothetical protein ACR2MB_06805 [Acidimicrobiales bacterium]
MQVEGGATFVVAAAIADLLADRTHPVLVALDGRSGAGKTTLARAVAAKVGAGVIEGDAFYAGGTAEAWDAMTPAAMTDHCVDWARQREVLTALASGRDATWFPYDWNADDGRLSTDSDTCRAAPAVILEGAYSARPELADLLDLLILLETDSIVRRDRLLQREGRDYRTEWEARWSVAEDHYFTSVMPPTAFDLTVHT